MKVYNENEKEIRHWCISLVGVGDGYAKITAVDSESGRHIADLINFYPDGSVLSMESAKGAINDRGYDANEHGNDFREDGSIIISS